MSTTSNTMAPTTGSSALNSTATPTTPETEPELTPEQLEAQQAAKQELQTHLTGQTMTDQQLTETLLEDIIESEKLKKEAELPPSPFATKIDKWGERRGRELIKDEVIGKRLKDHEVDEYEAADLYEINFSPEPQLHPKPVDKLRSQFLQQMFDTTEYQELHSNTAGDNFASELATVKFAESYAKVRKQQQDIDRENAQRAQKGQGPKTGPGSKPNVIGAVAQALQGAQQAVQEYNDMCDAMGWGNEAGSNSQIDPTRINKAMQRINKSQNLKRIMEWAGRFKIVASSCQRDKVTVGLDEVVGVVTDNDVSRLLPQELVQFDDEITETLFMSRFLERQTLCRQYQAHEPKGRGPIVVIVDESGSMSGNRIETAKGMMLAIGWIARKQKRWLTLGAFSSGMYGARVETFDSGSWDESKMLGWLEKFINGGTSLEFPLQGIPDYLDKLPGCPKGKIDFIIITDDEVDCSEELRQSFTKWKKANKVRLLSILIGSQPGVLETLSDEVYRVNALTLDCDATKAAFSI